MFLVNMTVKTKKIELALITVLLPESHPARMTWEYALLDLLCDGYVMFSTGRSYNVFCNRFQSKREKHF